MATTDEYCSFLLTKDIPQTGFERKTTDLVTESIPTNQDYFLIRIPTTFNIDLLTNNCLTSTFDHYKFVKLDHDSEMSQMTTLVGDVEEQGLILAPSFKSIYNLVPTVEYDLEQLNKIGERILNEKYLKKEQKTNLKLQCLPAGFYTGILILILEGAKGPIVEKSKKRRVDDVLVDSQVKERKKRKKEKKDKKK
jgi:hypothetical protein